MLGIKREATSLALMARGSFVFEAVRRDSSLYIATVSWRSDCLVGGQAEHVEHPAPVPASVVQLPESHSKAPMEASDARLLVIG